jgi:hypothetical protein
MMNSMNNMGMYHGNTEETAEVTESPK